MFIRIPGTTAEGDFAALATSHSTLEDALSEAPTMRDYDTLIVLDTATVPLTIAANAQGYRTRTEAQEVAKKIAGHPLNQIENGGDGGRTDLIPGDYATILISY